MGGNHFLQCRFEDFQGDRTRSPLCEQFRAVTLQVMPNRLSGGVSTPKPAVLLGKNGTGKSQTRSFAIERFEALEVARFVPTFEFQRLFLNVAAPALREAIPASQDDPDMQAQSLSAIPLPRYCAVLLGLDRPTGAQSSSAALAQSLEPPFNLGHLRAD